MCEPSCFLKQARDGAFRRSDGSEFQTVGARKVKERTDDLLGTFLPVHSVGCKPQTRTQHNTTQPPGNAEDEEIRSDKGNTKGCYLLVT